MSLSGTRAQSWRADAEVDENWGLERLPKALKYSLTSIPQQPSKLKNVVHPLYLENLTLAGFTTQRVRLHGWAGCLDIGWYVFISLSKEYPQLTSLIVKFGNYNKETAQGGRKNNGFVIGGLSLSPASGISRLEDSRKLSPCLLVFSSEWWVGEIDDLERHLLKLWYGKNIVVPVFPNSLAEGSLGGSVR